MNAIYTEKQLIIGKLSLPDVICDTLKDYIFVDNITSNCRKRMRDTVLVLIKGMRCAEEVDPLTYATGITQSYRFYKDYQTEKRKTPTYTSGTMCATCGNYRELTCTNSMCGCTNSYQEWSEHDDNNYHENMQDDNDDWYDIDWYDTMMVEEELEYESDVDY